VPLKKSSAGARLNLEISIAKKEEIEKLLSATPHQGRRTLSYESDPESSEGCSPSISSCNESESTDVSPSKGASYTEFARDFQIKLLSLDPARRQTDLFG